MLKPAPGPSGHESQSVVFGERAILTVFRRLEYGVNPALEVGRVLTSELHFAQVPRLLGALEYAYRPDEEPITVGMLESYIHGAITALQFTGDWLDRFLEHVVTLAPEHWPALKGEQPASLWEMAAGDPPPEVHEHLGGYLEHAALLGQRSGEMHAALARSATAGFVPIPFSQLYQRSLEQTTRKLTSQAFQMLRRRCEMLPEELTALAEEVLQREKRVQEVFHSLLKPRYNILRIRCHGDFCLSQVLYTGRDFVIVDFEGEPGRELAVRRIPALGGGRRGRHGAIVPASDRAGVVALDAHRIVLARGPGRASSGAGLLVLVEQLGVFACLCQRGVRIRAIARQPGRARVAAAISYAAESGGRAVATNESAAAEMRADAARDS